MRSIFLSDIHGNMHALEAVIRALPEHDEVVVAGDLCLDGPHPARVWDRLVELGWQLLMGNTDRDIASFPVGVKPKHRASIAWTREQLGPERVARLGDLPFSLRAGRDGSVLAVHANPRTIDEHLYPTMTEKDLKPYLAGIDAEIIVFGHLHIPYVRPVGSHVLVDVSSAGHPKDHDRRAAFTVVEWQGGTRSIMQVRVPYDIDATVDALRRSDMPDANGQAEALLKASY